MPHTYADLLKIVDATPLWHPPTTDAVAPADYVDSIAGTETGKSESDASAEPAAAPDNGKAPESAEATKSNEATESNEGADGIERTILDRLCLDVFGEYPGGQAVIFASHKARRKLAIIEKPDKITYAGLLQLAGPPVKVLVRQGDTDDDVDRMPMSTVRNAICYYAGYRRLSIQSLSGPGCWSVKDAAGHRRPGVVLVGAREGAYWDPESKTLTRLTHARHGGRLLDFSLAWSWFEFETLQKNLDLAADRKWVDGVLQQVIAQFDRWHWKFNKFSPTIVAGLILASWVQTLWTWRPQVAIIGATKTGKSIFLETLDSIFGHLGVRSSKSTAAGVRQAIQTSGKVVMVDEFEDSKHRDELLEMARAGGRGDKILRGTTSQRVIEFIVQHIFFMAAIDMGLSRAPDRNRYITLELDEPLEINRGKLALAGSEELQQLGQQLLAVAIRYIHDAQRLAVRLKTRKHPTVDVRVVESYAVPASILAAAGGYTDDEANGILGKMLGIVEPDDQNASDEEDLVNALLSATIKFSQYEMTVAEMLKVRSKDYDDILSRYGVGFTREPSDKPGEAMQEYLFFDSQVVTQRLLRGTYWERQSPTKILGRIPGAIRGQRRVWGRRPRGVGIPMSYVENLFLRSDESGSESEEAENGGRMW